MKVFAAHNADENIRRESSAGGVFSIIATKVIETGGVVYGAAFDSKWQVVHRRVDNVSDLSLFRGSKYVYSKFAPAITNAINDLNDGRRVLFSGTPCQVAAMRKRAGENENLLLVEVVCHGAPEPQYWERYLDEVCTHNGLTRQDIVSISFRDKRTGWKSYSFTITFKNGKTFTQRGSVDLYMRAFLSDYTIRRACFQCPFKYPDNSKADITLGDFWGIEKVAPQINNNLGTTIAVCRTKLGESTIGIIQDATEVDFESICRYNPAIVAPARKPELYDCFAEEAKTADRLVPIFDKYAGIKLLGSIKNILRRVISLLGR